MVQAHGLVKSLNPDAVIADSAFDAGHLLDAILIAGAELVIAPRKHRSSPDSYDGIIYKEHNRIERFLDRLKWFRCVATRYEKLLANFRVFAQPAAIAILLTLIRV